MNRRSFISRLTTSFSLLVAIYGTPATIFKPTGCFSGYVVYAASGGDANPILPVAGGLGQPWSNIIDNTTSFNQPLYAHAWWEPTQFFDPLYEVALQTSESRLQRNCNWRVEFPALTDADRHYMHLGLLRARIADRRSKGGLTRLPLP